MVMADWNTMPEAAPVDAGTYRVGEVLKRSSTAGRLAKATAKGDTVVAVVAASKIHQRTGIVYTCTAGDKISVYPLGNGMKAKVRVKNGTVLTPGCTLYMDDSVDGQVTTTADTSRPVCRFPDYGAPGHTVVEKVSGRGQAVDCILDQAVGASTV